MKNIILVILTLMSINYGFSQAKKAQIPLKNHTVLPKETVYGVAKQYGITVQDLINFNPSIADEGLKLGQIIKIPAKGTAKPTTFKVGEVEKPKDKNTTVMHDVLPKETKYAIAKKYNLTVQELEKLNPEIIPGLPIGYKLYISGKRPKVATTKIVTSKLDSTKVIKGNVLVKKAPKFNPDDFINYRIKSKETLYSLSKMFSLSQENLLEINPELAAGVQEAMIIKVPMTTFIKTETKKEKTDLLKFSKNNSKKKLAILLPFNITKIEGDTINDIKQRLKKDNFLNMTLDFYAGALIAIDSAKTLGLSMDIKFLDSQENKSTSNVENLIVDNDLKNYDALIGPFYKIHSDKAAQLLEDKNVPVISPLSKDTGKAYSNSYTSMPSSEYVKDEIFDFMIQNKGNILAIIDPKKTAIKQYIEENQTETKIINFTEKGVLDLLMLKNSIVKGTINYVILASEKTNTILSLTTALLNLSKENDIRLVILENNETLDFEEIPLSRLTKLKLTYPSLSRDNNTVNAKIFENSYKRKNKTYPSQYATRGFDITFDTMMRLSQNKSFEQTINESVSEQVESKFDYFKKVSGGYVNRGVFILQYNPDLTITEAE